LSLFVIQVLFSESIVLTWFVAVDCAELCFSENPTMVLFGDACARFLSLLCFFVHCGSSLMASDGQHHSCTLAAGLRSVVTGIGGEIF
jgi:hypothetical protein